MKRAKKFSRRMHKVTFQELSIVPFNVEAETNWEELRAAMLAQVRSLEIPIHLLTGSVSRRLPQHPYANFIVISNPTHIGEDRIFTMLKAREKNSLIFKVDDFVFRDIEKIND